MKLFTMIWFQTTNFCLHMALIWIKFVPVGTEFIFLHLACASGWLNKSCQWSDCLGYPAVAVCLKSKCSTDNSIISSEPVDIHIFSGSNVNQNSNGLIVVYDCVCLWGSHQREIGSIQPPGQRCRCFHAHWFSMAILCQPRHYLEKQHKF